MTAKELIAELQKLSAEDLGKEVCFTEYGGYNDIPTDLPIEGVEIEKTKIVFWNSEQGEF